MKITALAGGVGGARFLRGLLDHLDAGHPRTERPEAGPTPPRLTVIGNTGDDITLFGLRVCPDLDTLLYTLGDGVDEGQGWGRAEESYVVQGELAAYGATPQWFRLGDRDMATHIARSQWLYQGSSMSDVTAALAARWGLPQRGVRLLPMSDSPVETHVVIANPERRLPPEPPVDSAGGPPAEPGSDPGAGDVGDTSASTLDEDVPPEEIAVHFQEWWVRMHATVPAIRFGAVGLELAAPAPGVLEAIADADLILLPPSNPVVSIGVILGVPGLRDALRAASAPIVGVSPIIGGRPVRGYADACLDAVGVPATAAGVAGLYADLLAGWLVDDADVDSGPWPDGVVVRGRDLLMRNRADAAALAGATLDLARSLA